jgi:hypothetical protein
MKNKIVLSLVMAAAVTLGGATMLTNANFNATATSTGNMFKLGNVALLSPGVAVGQSIEMGSLFNVTNAGTGKEMVSSKQIVIAGNLPVKLSLGDLIYNDKHKSDPREPEYIVNPNNCTMPQGVISTWWRHYKMATDIQVYRGESWVAGASQDYDSFFDTLNGAGHTGKADTKGLDALLKSLGTLQPGDVVTIKTKIKFDQTTYYTTDATEHNNSTGRIDGDYTLTQDEVNAFQGKVLGVNLKLVATEQ